MNMKSTLYVLHCIIHKNSYSKACLYVMHVIKRWIFRAVFCTFLVSSRVSYNMAPHCTGKVNTVQVSGIALEYSKPLTVLASSD